MEVLGPVTLGFLVYTFLLLMQFLFRSAEMIVRRDVPADIVGKLLLLDDAQHRRLDDPDGPLVRRPCRNGPTFFR